MKVKDYEGMGVWCSLEEAKGAKNLLTNDELINKFEASGIEVCKNTKFAAFLQGEYVELYAAKDVNGTYKFFDGAVYSVEPEKFAMEAECVARALCYKKDASELRRTWFLQYLNETDKMTWDTMPDQFKPGMRWLAKNGYITGQKSVQEWDAWKKKNVYSNGIFLTEKGEKFLKENGVK